MPWLRRRSTPWILMVGHAVVGTMVVGLANAAWSLGRHGLGVRCWITGCLDRTTATTVLVAAAYFVASVLSAIPLGIAEWTGDRGTPARAALAAIGPPSLFALLTWAIV